MYIGLLYNVKLSWEIYKTRPDNSTWFIQTYSTKCAISIMNGRIPLLESQPSEHRS